MAPTGPDGEGESDDDPGGANQADLGYQGEGVATSGKNTFTFPFFFKICFILFPFFSGWWQLSKTKPREKKKKQHGNFYELLVPKHQRHLLY